MPPPIINDPTKELGYAAERSGIWVVGKQSAEAIGESVAHNVSAESARNVSSLLGGFSGVGGLVTIGLSGAISAALTEMDHNHRKDNLKELYKEELSLKLKKPADRLARADLEEMAKSNNVIKEELARNRKQRNFGVAMSFVASMASLAVITIALPQVLTFAVGAVAADAALAGFGGFLIKGLVGLLTYNAVKKPLHAIADKLFDIDEKTTNDYIVGIKNDRTQGKIISREQVLAVYAAANPELDQYIVAEYGKHFDDLSIEDKQRATKELNAVIPLDRLTLEINSGKVNVSELAFAVEGDISGVNHEKSVPEAPKPGLISAVFSSVGHMLGMKSHKHDHGHEHEHEFTVKAVAHASASAMEQRNHPEKGFGTQRQGIHKTHVEHLEQSRSEAGVSLGMPT